MRVLSSNQSKKSWLWQEEVEIKEKLNSQKRKDL